LAEEALPRVSSCSVVDWQSWLCVCGAEEIGGSGVVATTMLSEEREVAECAHGGGNSIGFHLSGGKRLLLLLTKYF
jgi:hypothetical protein